MLFTGLSFKIRDNRVDRIALKQGYVNYEVFYSPIIIWAYFTIILIVISLPFSYLLFDYWYWIIGVLFVGYLISAYLNNSFILTKDELLVINPNFPFAKFTKLKINSIENVEINKNKWLSVFFVFLIIENYYIKVNFNGRSRIYYCNGLKPDAYDENFTEMTLDSFSFELSKRNIKVLMKV